MAAHEEFVCIDVNLLRRSQRVCAVEEEDDTVNMMHVDQSSSDLHTGALENRLQVGVHVYKNQSSHLLKNILKEAQKSFLDIPNLITMNI